MQAKRLSTSSVVTISWALSLAVVSIAVVAWGGSLDWQTAALTNAYTFFPLLGLSAFSLMWSHYMAAVLRTASGHDKSVLRSYFSLTSLAVLALILLHPGILALQLWRDGRGLPPGSELGYVAPDLSWAVMLAVLCLLIFLAYEFHRFYGARPWWRFVQYASDAAMLGIFVHSLTLGSTLREGWFRSVWIFYGVTLVASFFYTYTRRHPMKT